MKVTFHHLISSVQKRGKYFYYAYAARYAKFRKQVIFLARLLPLAGYVCNKWMRGISKG